VVRLKTSSFMFTSWTSSFMACEIISDLYMPIYHIWGNVRDSSIEKQTEIGRYSKERESISVQE
jgi:hypothetical protein